MSEQFQIKEAVHTVEPIVDPARAAAPALGEIIKQGVTSYLDKLGGTPPVGLYDLVIETVEEPLLQVVMRYTNNNQVKAAKLLGIARGTLRTRLKKYDMID